MGNWPLTCTMILILHLVCFHCCLCCFCYASTRPVDGARGSMFCACVHRCQTETFLTGLLSIFSFVTIFINVGLSVFFLVSRIT